MDDDDISPPTQAPATQTQPDVSGLISDIFGEDSDDDDIVPKARVNPVFYGDDNDSLGDSDDEPEVPKKKTKLIKGGSKKISSKADSDDDVSDDDEDAFRPKKIDKQKKRKLDSKTKSKSRESTSESRIKKRSKPDKTSHSSSADKADNGDSGDEYDSGEEVQKTAEDEDFIDKNDELDDITKEYDEEQQRFDDERPDKVPGKGKSGSKSSSSSSSGSNYISKRDTDPLSLTLLAIKKPKQTEMVENEKARVVTDLLRRMDIAARLDDECFRQKTPATNKLQLVKTVQQIVNIRALHSTLLEYDILAAFKDWLEPKDSSTLPSLEVRTALYKMLLSLPCQVDHLKRTSNGKQPIGVTIVALRKHKMETPENKRLLKEIMEKWSRPVFGKAVDTRGASGKDSAELREVIAQRMMASQAANNALRATSPGAVAESQLDSMLSGATSAPADGIVRNRAQTPYSSGFLFTVQPEYKVKNIDKVAGGGPKAAGGGSAAAGAGESKLGEARDNLLKIIKANKPAPATMRGDRVGKKQEVRAVNMVLNGRNKA